MLYQQMHHCRIWHLHSASPTSMRGLLRQLGMSCAAAAAAARGGCLGAAAPASAAALQARRRYGAACWGRTAAAAAAAGAPAALGDPIRVIDTPALLVDLDAFERNCTQLREVMRAFPGVSVRPHAKAHKCPQLARLQLQLLDGLAVGVCCQKVSEAEAMVAGGISDVLISNEVVAPSKIARLLSLAAQGARVSVVVDAAGPLEQLAEAAQAWGGDVSVDVLVEVNVGQDRAGVDSPAQAAALAKRVAQLQASSNGAVALGGIQAYHGGLQHVRDPRARANAVAHVAAAAADAVAAVRDATGLGCRVVTGGGSGTYRLEAGSGVFTEVQPGSFVFGDADYARNIQPDGRLGEWEQSLWVLTQVMSVSQSRSCAVVDAGTKAVSLDSGPPQLLEAPNVAAGLLAPPGSGGGAAGALPSMSFEGVEFQNGGDEHGKLLWPLALPQSPPQLPPLGTKLLLQPGHCDPTVNLFDELVVVRGGRVVAIWPVAARGPGR